MEVGVAIWCWTEEEKEMKQDRGRLEVAEGKEEIELRDEDEGGFGDLYLLFGLKSSWEVDAGTGGSGGGVGEACLWDVDWIARAGSRLE